MQKRKLTGWGVGVGALALYALTLSRAYTGDGLLYALDVESGDPLRLIDFYHLLSHPLGWGFYRSWQLLGWTGRAILPLQLLNALCGAAAVALLTDLVLRVTRFPRAALLAGAGFAVSGGIWLLSVEAEFVTPQLAATLLVLRGLLTASPQRLARPSYALLLGCGVALAALAYANSLFLVPVAAGVFLTLEEPLRPRLRQAFLVALGALLPLVVVYLPLVVLATRWDAPGAWMLWHGGSAYGGMTAFDLPHGVYAFLRSLALYPNLAMSESSRAYLATGSLWERGAFVVYYLAVLALAATPLLVALRGRRTLWEGHRRTLTALAVWSALYAAFAWYWVPGDVTFWVPVTAAWWTLVGLELSSLPSPRATRRSTRAALAVALALFALNASLAILPRRFLPPAHPRHVAREVGGRVPPDALVIFEGEGMESLYLTYLTGHRAFSLPPRSEGPGRLSAVVRERIADVRREGHPVYLVGVGDAWLDALVGDDVELQPAFAAGKAVVWEVRVP